MQGIRFNDVDEAIVALPELRTLQPLVENNDWHDDTVYDQSVRLWAWVKGLPETLAEKMVAPTETIAAWLDTSVDVCRGKYPGQELLAFAALIHDLGKRETLERLANGQTRCPGHEAVSAQLAARICARFDFSEREAAFVVRLAAAHGQPYALYKQAMEIPAAARRQAMDAFAAEQGSLWPALLIFACGDLMTSHMRQRNPGKYQAVLAFYQLWLNGVNHGCDDR